MCRTLGFQDGFVAAGGEEVSEVQASAVWSECQRNSALPLFPSLLQSCLFIHAFSLFLWGALTLVLDPMAQGCLSVLCFFHTGELQGELLSNNIIIKKQKKKSQARPYAPILLDERHGEEAIVSFPAGSGFEKHTFHVFQIFLSCFHFPAGSMGERKLHLPTSTKSVSFSKKVILYQVTVSREFQP